MYVGSADGHVYAFEAAMGRLLWEFRAAPPHRWIPVFGKLSSTWPVAGGVIVDKGIVYAAAGKASPYILLPFVPTRPGRGRRRRCSASTEAPADAHADRPSQLAVPVGGSGIVVCRNAKNGTFHWRERVGGTYYGSPVAVGDAIYCLLRAGEAVVVAASKQCHLLARNPIGEPGHSTPTVANGTMYLRTFSHLISLGGE